jgi:acyl carrier protein
MKRIFLYLIALVLSFTIVMSYINVAFAGTPGREWLILVYVSGSNDRGVAGFARDVINQLEKVGSSDKVAVVVKYTILGAGKERELQFQRDAKTLLIEGDKGNPGITSPVIDTSPRTDMASQSSLLLFVRKNMARYPSKKVMLVLWGKGEGLRGALNDEASGKRMSVKEMAQTFSKVRQETHRKIDVLAMDADSMQTAEILWELKDEADIVVGSEESASGCHYRYDLMLQEVVEEPTMSGPDLAGAMVYFAGDPVSSAVRSDRLPSFMKLLDRWVTAIMSDRAALSAAAGAVDGTFHFAMKDSKDLCDFIDRVAESVPSGSLVTAAGKELESFIQRELLLATHWALDPKILKGRPYGTRSHGLAIYLPDLVYDGNAYEPLAFASNSEWRRFLMAVLEERLKK